MSAVSFTISYESTEMIISFIKFILENTRDNMNIPECDERLSKIEDEMKKYENKACDVVIELCQKLRTIPRKTYMHGKTVAKTMTKFINAVNEVVSDEVFNSV